MAFPLFAPRRVLSQGGQLGDGVVPPPANTRVAAIVGRGAAAYGRAREVSALLVWTAAVFLLLALASYAGEPASAQVNADAQAAPSIVGANWVGPVGEACARALVTAIGVVSWAIPFELALLGIP